MLAQKVKFNLRHGSRMKQFKEIGRIQGKPLEEHY